MQTTRYLTLALVPLFLSGCDTLVEPSYRGESRLSLRVSVVKSQAENVETVIPAFAYVDESSVSFRAVDYRNTFAEFRVDVFDAPPAERLAPLDPFLTPDLLVAREYIGAVIPPRISKPIALNDRRIPVYPECWNGGCDYLPGRMTMACADDDEACLERQRQCPNGMCQLVSSGAVLPEGVEDVIGFSNEYLVLYTPQPIAAGSWAALKLGAPDGLEPGYHLGKNVQPSPQASTQADDCVTQAVNDVFASFNAKHGTAYDGLQKSCLDGTRPAFSCEGVELPEGAERRELATLLSAAELERGCLELAPKLEFIRHPMDESISVRINGKAPAWLPSVAPAASPLEEVECPRETNPETGEPQRPELKARLTSYTGELCPEGSIDFSESSGVFGANIFGADLRGKQSCQLSFSLTVPAGYRFRRPLFLLNGFTYSESESVRPTFITLTYTMAGDPMSSHHIVLPSVDGATFALMDTPEISVPECSAACEPMELELKLDMEVDAPEGTTNMLYDFTCSNEVGVEWATCSKGFAAR